VTVDLLNKYKDMIENTAADLDELLQGIDQRMKSNISQVPGESAEIDHPEDEEINIKEEKASIEQCLRICDEVSSHIEEVQGRDVLLTSTLAGERPATAKPGGITTATVSTSKTLENCKRGLGITSSELKMQLIDLNNKVQNFSQHAETLGGNASDNNQSKKEVLKSIEACVAICDQATEQVLQERINVFEDVEMADDAHSVIVATLGDLISAKRITAGARSTMWLGQMSDASLQQLSKDRVVDGVRTGRDPESGAHFEGRHGAGRKLR
jgi:hypothetical protein